MDTQIAIWEMNLESDGEPITREEIATWPSEPYTIDWESINWNWALNRNSTSYPLRTLPIYRGLFQ